MRLGFAVKALGQPGLKSNDTRRWPNNPHLSVSLAYVRDIFVYLQRVGIKMYRLSSELAPYATHPDLPQFHHQVEDCRAELAAIGQMARRLDLRLSFHPSQYVVLSATDEKVASQSMADIENQAQMLEAMELDDRAVVVLHVGGAYEDKIEAMNRFVERWYRLSPVAQRRLVLENDERSYGVPEILRIHERIGIRLIFDYLHFLNNNPARQTVREALAACLNTWPTGNTPKVHFSSPRTEMRVAEQHNPTTGKLEHVLKPPLWTQHADFVNPFEFIAFLQATCGLRDVDIMLEVKAKDLALLRLRADLRDMAPEFPVD